MRLTHRALDQLRYLDRTGEALRDVASLFLRDAPGMVGRLTEAVA